MIERVVLKKSYVYAILVDGIVRYIGKGISLSRMLGHVKEAERINRKRDEGKIIKTTKFYNKLAKALLDKAVIGNEIIAKGLSNAKAFEREAEEIAKCPKDQLWNIAPGGVGFNIDELLDAEAYFVRLREGMIECNKKPETKLNRSKGAKRRWESEENRKQHREDALPAWTAELRKEHGEKLIARFSSYEEFLEYNSRISKMQWTPEKRLKKSVEAKAMQAARAAKKHANLYCSVLAFGA